MMSLYDYMQSQMINGCGFYALIMAAMRNADDANLEKLKSVFPEVYEELQQRYHAPSGKIGSE